MRPPLLWHMAKLRYREEVPAEERADFERLLGALACRVAAIRQLIVAPAADEPHTIGLVVIFDSESEFAEYLVCPAHDEVTARARALLAEVVRLNLQVPELPR